MKNISCIVSAYYAERFLNQRLMNLFDQNSSSLSNPEIIVICQKGSAEEAIAEKYASDIRIIKTIDIPTVYSAWNLGAVNATGDYVISANSDDLFYPQALEIMSETLDEHPEVDVVFSDVDRMIGEEGRAEVWKRDAVKDLHSCVVPDIFDRLKKACFIGVMPMWRRSLHDTFGYFDADLKVAGDWDFWLRLAKGGTKFYYIPCALGLYLKHEGSAEHRDPDVAQKERDMVMARYR